MLDMTFMERVGVTSGHVRRMRRDEYAALVARGVLDGERIELLHGSLVAMSPIDPDHDEAVSKLTELLSRRLAGRARVRPQCSFLAADESVPLPDVVVAPAGSYRGGHPSRALLLVEVARTSLAKDRDDKALLYASSDVDEYWVVNLIGRCVEVHRMSRDGQWQHRATCWTGDTLAPLAFPDLQIVVAEILP